MSKSVTQYISKCCCNPPWKCTQMLITLTQHCGWPTPEQMETWKTVGQVKAHEKDEPCDWGIGSGCGQGLTCSYQTKQFECSRGDSVLLMGNKCPIKKLQHTQSHRRIITPCAPQNTAAPRGTGGLGTQHGAYSVGHAVLGGGVYSNQRRTETTNIEGIDWNVGRNRYAAKQVVELSTLRRRIQCRRAINGTPPPPSYHYLRLRLATRRQRKSGTICSRRKNDQTRTSNHHQMITQQQPKGPQGLSGGCTVITIFSQPIPAWSLES